MNLILKSYDYSRFEFFEQNRRVVSNKVGRIAKSIEQIDLTDISPIIVFKDGGRYKIIDGQHRFMALKSLGRPIYFTVFNGSEKDAFKAMMSLNYNASVWRTEEFIEYYAASNDMYLGLLNFARENKMSLNSAMCVYCEPQTNCSYIKRGVSIFHKYEYADYIIGILNNDSVRQLRFHKMRNFIVSIRRFVEENGIKKTDRLMKKILLVPECVSQEGYMTVFNNLIKK